MPNFDTISEFEHELAKYTGAPYAVMTDCCTHALELCFRVQKITHCSFTRYTYISIPMMLMKLGIKFEYNDIHHWTGQYWFDNTNIYDSARLFRYDMYIPGQMQCLSFGYDKPFTIGRGGAILLDNEDYYKKLKKMCYDGRDLSISPWEDQQEFNLGFHYKPTIEEAEIGLRKLRSNDFTVKSEHKYYPDLSKITIKNV